MKEIKKDDLVILSSIADDFSEETVIHCICQALEDINLDELRHAWIELNPDQDKNYDFKMGNFIEWLKQKKIIKELNMKKIHNAARWNIDLEISSHVAESSDVL